MWTVRTNNLLIACFALLHTVIVPGSLLLFPCSKSSRFLLVSVVSQFAPDFLSRVCPPCLRPANVMSGPQELDVEFWGPGFYAVMRRPRTRLGPPDTLNLAFRRHFSLILFFPFFSLPRPPLRSLAISSPYYGHQLSSSFSLTFLLFCFRECPRGLPSFPPSGSL